MSSGGAGRLEAVPSGGAANAAVNAGGEAAKRAGEKEGGGRPLLLRDRVKVGGEEEAKWTGQRVRVVSTSFTNSVSLARSHWRRWARQGRAKGKGGA